MRIVGGREQGEDCVERILSRVLEVIFPKENSSVFVRMRRDSKPPLAGWMHPLASMPAGSAALPGNQTARLPSADRSGCAGDRSSDGDQRELERAQ